ncbi:MAG TPA: EAL domain-containing protein [Actinomycetales bacterium]
MTIPTAALGLDTTTVSLARQPVLSRDGSVYGYELLFRGSAHAHGFDATRATAEVLVAAACDLGWGRLGGGLPLFLNVDAAMLANPLITMAPPAETVIEIVEDVLVDDEVEARVRELRAAGYRIALDDYLPGTSADRLLDCTDVVKIDVLIVPQEEWAGLVDRLHLQGLVVVAEKVESEAAHRAALAAGFDLLQGFWYARPDEQRQMSMSPRTIVCLRLLTALNSDDYDLRAVEELVTSDAVLAMRTLRMANSAAMGAARTISSVNQALVMVGPAVLSGWIALMLVTASEGDGDAGSVEVLVRARACQMTSQSRMGGSGGQAFLAGLIIALADRGSMHPQHVLETLGASETIRLAVQGEGQVGRLVHEVEAHVSGGVSDAELDVQMAHLAAVVWGHELLRMA